MVNEIAAQLTGQTDIDEILQTAVRQVGQALRAPQVNINLALAQDGETDPIYPGERLPTKPQD
jgi:GAF domain-containing protein